MIEGSEVVNYSTAKPASTNINKQHPYTNRTEQQIMLRSIQFYRFVL